VSGAPVVDARGRPIGVISQSDLVRHQSKRKTVGDAGRFYTDVEDYRDLLDLPLDRSSTPVREVMTATLITTRPESPLDECASLMTSRRIRHLPVIGPEGLCGVVTTGDLMAFQVADQAVTIAQLNSYVYDNR